jgi:hypothetical protein
MFSFSSRITPGSLPSEEIIRSSVKRRGEFFLGHGSSSDVFAIDRYPGYVVRIPYALDLSEITEFGVPKIIDDSKLEGKNFGQIIAEFKCGISIALRQRGEAVGLSVGQIEPNNQEKNDKLHEEKTRCVAAMSQEAYCQLISEMKFLNSTGKHINTTSANKLLFDVKGDKFNFIDIADKERNDDENTPAEILGMLFDIAYARGYEGQGRNDK